MKSCSADHSTHYALTQADPNDSTVLNFTTDRQSETEFGCLNSPFTVVETQNNVCTLKNSAPSPDGNYKVILKHFNY